VTVLRRFLGDRRRSLLWWSVGMVGVVATTVSVYPSIKGQASFEDLMKDLPAPLKAVIGAQAGVAFTSPVGYLHSRMFTSLVPIVLLIFGIGLGARAIGGAEDDGTLELVLANPVTRRRLFVEQGAAVVGLLAVLVAVGVVALFLLGPLFDALDGVSTAHLLGAWAAVASLALLHTALAFAVGAARGHRAPALAAAATVAVAGYMLEGLLAVTDALSPLRLVSPWHWYLARNALVDGTTPQATLLPVLVAAGLAAFSAWRFERRDLR
jgi:ABC-2 type transport system permease protein